ncbi:MAG: mechanosensitive ion channel [Gammaproteobacteria bacterium]|nr:mechanosensitive ion channel [Gammaproteobacteria bacterium]
MEQELAQVTEIYNLIITYLVAYSFQILGAAVIMVVGVFIARKLASVVLSLCQRKKLDITLSRFFASFTRIAIIASTVVIILPKLGIQITPFIAAIGALGLGAGLAVQGLLSNYGAGLSIILSRPFVVGDTVHVQGVWGLVKEVNLSHTILTNEDGELITIPNKHIIGEIIHNSQADTILELSVGIGYDSDTAATIDLLEQSLGSLGVLSEDRPVQVGIDNFGDSSIDIGIRCWVPTESFHDVRYQCTLAIHDVLKERGVVIPFPQREVRMLS